MERLLTVEDVCELLQFKKSYVYRLTHRDEIPHFKIGNHLRFRRSELEAWIGRKANGDGRSLLDGEERRDARL
ncbi:helix-turn-helix domain-containing protein [Candidatus Poribacteria bacterium]|nr:helix-turn-helix domain-containing protein [Candidatus Poribacteria bacterium]